MEGILLIQSIFKREIGETAIIPWDAGYYQGQRTVEVSNRYFSSAMMATNEEQVPFHPLVDPNSVLSKIAKEGQYMHTADNQVRYLERTEHTGGRK